MSGWTGWLSELGQRTVGPVWEPILVWTVLALGTLAALYLCRKAHPAVHEKVRSALVLALPLSMVLAFVGRAEWLPVPQRTIPVVSEWLVPFSETGAAAVPSAAGAVEGPAAAEANLSPTFWLGLTLVLGFAASGWLAGRLILHWRALRRLKRGLTFVDFSDLRPLLSNAGSLSTSATSSVRFAVADADVVPMTFGTLRPVVVVPRGLLRGSGGLTFAVAHELMHVRRRDVLFHTLERVIATVFAFHPLVHLLRAEIGQFREMACDAEVLAHTRCRPRDYAQALLRLADPPPLEPTAALGLFTPFTHLKRRVAAMNARSHQTVAVRSARRAGALLGLSVLIAGSAVVACSDVVSDPEIAGEELVPDDGRFGHEAFADALRDARENHQGRLLVYFYGDDAAVSDNVDRYLFGNPDYTEFLDATFAHYAVKVDSPEGLDIMRRYNVTSHTSSPLLMILNGENRAALMTTLGEVDSPEAGSVKIRQILLTVRLASIPPMGGLRFDLRDYAGWASTGLSFGFGTHDDTADES